LRKPELESLLEDASRFITEKVALAATVFSKVCMAVAPIYAEENIPFLNQCGTDQVTAKGWPNMIRVYPRNAQESPKIAQLVARHFGGRKLAVIHSTDEFETNLAEGVVKVLDQKHGVRPDAVYKLPEKGDDFSATITRLKDQKIGVVYLGLWSKAAGLFLRQSDAAGYRPQFIGNTAYIDSDIARIAGRAMDGLVFTTAADPDYRPEAQEVVKALAAKGFAHRILRLHAGEALRRRRAKSGKRERRRRAENPEKRTLRHDHGAGVLQRQRRRERP
jgi:branched-chain amino acid transport system substrate-binding protein